MTPEPASNRGVERFAAEVLEELGTEEEPESGIGRFEILGRVGRGGMGEVLRVRDPDRDQEVALKRVLVESLSAEERFLREARILARINHPNVVRVHDVEVEPIPFFTMQLVDGVPLQEWAEARRSEPRAVVRAFSQLARAVQHLHDEGVLHRDLTPQNILIRDDATPILIDFGVAESQAEDRLTRTGVGIGTPGYASPEQSAGLRVDARSDIFTLGVSLYVALSGNSPTLAGTRTEEELPTDLARIVDRCVARAPAARYKSAEDFGRDLDRWLNDRVSAPEGSPRETSTLPAYVCLVLSQVIFLSGLVLSPEAQELSGRERIWVAVASVFSASWVTLYVTRFYIHFARLSPWLRAFNYLVSAQLVAYACIALLAPKSWSVCFGVGAGLMWLLNLATGGVLKARLGLLPKDVGAFLDAASGKQRAVTAWLLGVSLFVAFGLEREAAWFALACVTSVGSWFTYRAHLSPSNAAEVVERCYL